MVSNNDPLLQQCNIEHGKILLLLFAWSDKIACLDQKKYCIVPTINIQRGNIWWLLFASSNNIVSLVQYYYFLKSRNNDSLSTFQYAMSTFHDTGTSWLCFLLGLKIFNAWSSNNVILLEKSNIKRRNIWRLVFAWSNNIACLVEWYCLFRPEITFLCWKESTVSVGTSGVCYCLVQQ